MKLMGVINLDNEQDFLNELTETRCGASVPYGGRYRLIDFVISNMASAGMIDIAIFTRNKYRALLDHVGTGKWWDLDNNFGGLFILPPYWHDSSSAILGDMKHFENNVDFFHRGKADYVMVSGSQHICNIDYGDVYDQHINSDADITVVYKTVKELAPEHDQCRKLTLNSENNISCIDQDKNNHNIFMNMYLIKKDLLLTLIENGKKAKVDSFFNELIATLPNDLTIKGYEYKGVHTVINSIPSYFKANLELLKRDFYKNLFFSAHPITTKVKNEPPARYLCNSNVSNSIVGSGCEIDGIVENSILFRGVVVKKGAVIRNSIIMRKCQIEEDAHVENVILDKEVFVTENQSLFGELDTPLVIPKRKIV